jgi:hypothetical protein
MELGLHQRISSPPGRVAEMTGSIEGGKRLTRIVVDKVTRWGDSSRIARPW